MGSRRFILTGNGAHGWASDARMDAAIVAAMRAAPSMSVESATPTGGAIAEVVGPGAAILAAPGNHDSLSRGMRRAIMDPGLRAQMAEASWQAGQRLPRWEDRAARFLDEVRAAAHG